MATTNVVTVICRNTFLVTRDEFLLYLYTNSFDTISINRFLFVFSLLEIMLMALSGSENGDRSIQEIVYGE